MYADGIDYIESIDPYFNTIRTFTGEVDFEIDYPYAVHSHDVTFKLNLKRASSFKSIEIYEYDNQHQLIKTTALGPMDNLSISYSADENAMYSFIKVISYESFGFGTYDHVQVYELKLGEYLELTQSDPYGLVRKEKFHYYINPLTYVLGNRVD